MSKDNTKATQQTHDDELHQEAPNHTDNDNAEQPISEVENVDDMKKDKQAPAAKEPAPSNGDQVHQELVEQIETLRREAQSNLEGWQRSRAEFTNYRKRTEREMRESFERASLNTLTKILPIVDDFERALNNVPEDLEDHPWLGGITLVMKKFEKLLEEYDVQTLDPVGEAFDPRLHEAVGMDDSDEYESGTVTATLQKGYISGERVLRPALVRVAS